MELKGCTHAWNYYTIRSRRRDEIAKALNMRGIETGIFYPNALQHGLPMAEAESATRTVLSLPMHTKLSNNEAETIINIINGEAKK